MVSIIVKGRKRLVRMQRDLINQVHNNSGKGMSGSEKAQKDRIRQFKEISKEGGLKTSSYD